MSQPEANRDRIIRGSAWVGLGFLGQQGVGFLRTVILARLLTPEDFGLVGIVTLTLFAGLILTESGVESALIQRRDLPPRHVNTAWTLTLARSAALFLIVQASAPWVAAAFDRPDAEPLLRVGAVSFLLVGLPAVPAALLLREMRFRARTALDAGRDIGGALCSIVLAAWFGSAWALLLGLLAGQAVAAVGVWFLRTERPRLAWDREAVAEYWTFGRHLYASGLLTYVVTRGDAIAVGRLRGVGELGQYQVVFGIAEMLTRGLIEVVGKAVFPAYSRILGEGRRPGEAFGTVWRLILLILLPIVVLLALFPGPVVLLVLGPRWAPAVAPFAVLVAAESLRALAAACGTLILAGGRTELLSRIKLAEAGVFAALIVPMTATWGMVGAAWSLVLAYAVSLAGHLYGAHLVEPLLGRIAALSVEPVAAAVLLAGAAGLSVGAGLSVWAAMAAWIGLWALYLWRRHGELLIILLRAVPVTSRGLFGSTER